MMLVPVFVCFSLLTSSCLCSPIKAPRVKKTVDLSYSCMRVKTEGQSDDGAPILLLHGLAMFKESWMGLHQIFALKTGRRVCVADLRNHGDSPWTDESDIASMAGDLNPLLAKLKTKKVILVGSSLGGKIALHFALTNPDKVEKLVVEDMRPNGVSDEAWKLVRFGMKLLQASIKVIPKGVTEEQAKLVVFKFIKDSLRMLNQDFGLDESKAHFLPIKCSNDKCDWKTNIKLLEKILENPGSYLTNSTGLFDKPALFIYGKESPFKVGDDKEEILKLFPKAQIVGIEGASHHLNGKPEYLDTVLKFINSKK